MSNTQLKSRVSIPKQEYERLKKLDAQFGELLAYASNVRDIAAARKEVKQKKFVSQEKLFKQLGF